MVQYVLDKKSAIEYSETRRMASTVLWRDTAWAISQNIPKTLGMTTREWVQEYYGNYVKLDIPDRRDAVKELSDDGLSNRAIAGVLGVHPSTVDDDLNAGKPAPSNGENEEDAGKPAVRGTQGTGTKSEEELKAQSLAEARICFTRNMLDALISTDRPAEEGRSCKNLYDPKVAARTGDKITPERLRRASAFLDVCANSMES